MFDTNVQAAQATIAEATDKHLLQPWTLLAGGQAVFTLPRITRLRSMIMNHSIHYSAQLGLSFRLNDIQVPAIYGTSVHEAGMS